MKISTLNKIILYFKWVWSIVCVILSIFIIYFQINYLRYSGIKITQVVVEIPKIKEIEKIVEKEQYIRVEVSSPKVIDLQGIISTIDNYGKDGRHSQLMITNDCPQFTHSTVCFITIEAPPTSSLKEAKRTL